MKLKVNPLVVAAALGLLGPAALAEDDDDRREARISGLWKRTGPSSPVPALLGDALQLITLEGRVLMEDGNGSFQGSWDLPEDGPALQELRVDGARVTRRFEADGDQLEVHTTVDSGDGQLEYTQVFVREA